MSDIYELIEYADELLKARQLEEAVPACEEVYAWMTRDILDTALRHHYLLPIPGESYMDLYLGHSEHLGAYKIGISRSAKARAHQLRLSNARHNLGTDFALIDYGTGPASAARAAERRIKQRYEYAITMGTEWICDTSEDVFDHFWIEREHLEDGWERTMREFDPLAQLDREAALIELLGGARGAAIRLRDIERKIRAWDAEYRRMLSRLQEVSA